ncbi:acyl-CoA thioesterase domain-containing protein [Pseudomonas viridiflava]|uniref:CdiA C-terminal domain-containing protein n=1 Tax=Pseudomonas viridiflava TaxID=33069 RepID=UPI0013CECB11|nr:acyl-CoA thioesterase domain-containing protein [Pseudomonas viridiflava]
MASLAEIFQSFDPSSPFIAPENWLQGRTVYGGLTAALALQTAMQAGGPDLPPLKSAQITFVGPAMHEQTFKPTVLRQGKSVTVMTADCFSSAQLALHMTMVFAASRDSRILHDYSQRPAVGRPDDYSLWDAGPQAPICVHNFQKKCAGGALPFSGANEASKKLAQAGFDVEQLANTGRKGGNPDLRINGDLADVFSPRTNSPISVLMTVTEKVEKQAGSVVVNLADSPLTSGEIEKALLSRPVDGLKKLYLMKNNEFRVIEASK